MESLNIAQPDVGMITFYCSYARNVRLFLSVIGVNKGWWRLTNPVKQQHLNCLPHSSWSAECDDRSCYSRSTIVAIRDSGATTEDFLAEYPEWTVDGICWSTGTRSSFPIPVNCLIFASPRSSDLRCPDGATMEALCLRSIKIPRPKLDLK